MWRKKTYSGCSSRTKDTNVIAYRRVLLIAKDNITTYGSGMRSYLHSNLCPPTVTGFRLIQIRDSLQQFDRPCTNAPTYKRKKRRIALRVFLEWWSENAERVIAWTVPSTKNEIQETPRVSKEPQQKIAMQS